MWLIIHSCVHASFIHSSIDLFMHRHGGSGAYASPSVIQEYTMNRMTRTVTHSFTARHSLPTARFWEDGGNLSEPSENIHRNSTQTVTRAQEQGAAAGAGVTLCQLLLIRCVPDNIILYNKFTVMVFMKQTSNRFFFLLNHVSLAVSFSGEKQDQPVRIHLKCTSALQLLM